MDKRNLTALGLVGAVALTTLSGCCTNPAAVDYGKPAIFGSVARGYYDGKKTLANINVSGTRLLPVVTIDSDTLELIYYSFHFEYLWKSQWHGYVSAAPGRECELVVDQSNGMANATTTLPGDFVIIQPDDLHIGDDLDIAWTNSAGAERYEVYIHVDYSYIDTSGGWELLWYDTSFCTTDTTFTVGKVRLFPDDVDSIMSGDGVVEVQAECGPWIGHGTEGNVEGYGCGYFLATNGPEAVSFDVEQESQKVFAGRETSPDDWFNRKLEELKAHDQRFW